MINSKISLPPTIQVAARRHTLIRNTLTALVISAAARSLPGCGDIKPDPIREQLESEAGLNIPKIDPGHGNTPDVIAPTVDSVVPDVTTPDAMRPDAMRPDAMRPDAGTILTNSLFTTLRITPTLINEFDRDESGWIHRSGTNGDPFACRFQPENISFSGGRMILALENDGCTKYRSAEESFGFGYYEVRMRPASGSGIMAGSFFTYTGTYGRPDHDEIDIEVLGQDCSIQLNHYGAGRGGHELVMTPTQLGFNPCAGEHNYGFVWRSDSIVYYIDGRMVHRATAQIPSRPGRIMVNIWSGAPSVDGWLGPYDAGSGRVTAQYDYIRWAPLP